MLKKIIGGVIGLAIGGTVFTISKSDIAKNFSKNTGLTQQQAEEYINNIPQSELDSFSKIGQTFIDDADSLLGIAKDIDCINYSYKWESPSLSCGNGKNQLQKTGNDEITLGHCYQDLDTDLGDSAKSKIKECVESINTVDSDYNLSIMTATIDASSIADWKKTNAYNKSLLEAALESK